jgi:hypothetical protein
MCPFVARISQRTVLVRSARPIRVAKGSATSSPRGGVDEDGRGGSELVTGLFAGQVPLQGVHGSGAGLLKAADYAVHDGPPRRPVRVQEVGVGCRPTADDLLGDLGLLGGQRVGPLGQKRRDDRVLAGGQFGKKCSSTPTREVLPILPGLHGCKL